MSAGIPQVETVAGFALAVAAAEPMEETKERWAQRVEALTQWLMAEWQRGHDEAAPCGNDRHATGQVERRHSGRGNQ